MSFKPFTTLEKLNEVERLIELGRPVRGEPGSPDNHRQEIFKAIAADLRGRLEGRPSETLCDLERRVVSVHRSKTALGYSQHALRGLAEGVMTRWPTVKQALEQFAEKSTGDAQ